MPAGAARGEAGRLRRSADRCAVQIFRPWVFRGDPDIRHRRQQKGIVPVITQVDALAAGFPAETKLSISPTPVSITMLLQDPRIIPMLAEEQGSPGGGA